MIFSLATYHSEIPDPVVDTAGGIRAAIVRLSQVWYDSSRDPALELPDDQGSVQAGTILSFERAGRWESSCEIKVGTYLTRTALRKNKSRPGE